LKLYIFIPIRKELFNHRASIIKLVSRDTLDRYFR